jgi:hypothetical protein
MRGGSQILEMEVRGYAQRVEAPNEFGIEEIGVARG